MYRFYCDFASHFIHFRAEKAKKNSIGAIFMKNCRKKPCISKSFVLYSHKENLPQTNRKENNHGSRNNLENCSGDGNRN